MKCSVAMREAAELRKQLADKASKEAESIISAANLHQDLGKLLTDYERELEEREVLLPEAEERESRSVQISGELNAARRARLNLRAETANLREDVSKLLKEAGWAKRYLSQGEAKRAHLQAKVKEAERSINDM